MTNPLLLRLPLLRDPHPEDAARCSAPGEMKMSHSTTALKSSLVARAERQEASSRLLRSTLDRHDVTQDDVAAACGVQQSKVAAWVDHRRQEAPALHDVGAMPREVALDLLRALAAALEMTLAPLPSAYAATDDVGALAAAAKEHGEAIAAAAACLTLGARATREQLLALERETTESLEATAALRERAIAKREQLELASKVRQLRGVGGA